MSPDSICVCGSEITWLKSAVYLTVENFFLALIFSRSVEVFTYEALIFLRTLERIVPKLFSFMVC